MSTTYRTTLVYLTADVTSVAPASERLEIGNQPIEDIIRLADRLLKVDTSVSPKTEPGIIVHRSDRSYRIAAHQGRLRLHKSVSLFDDYWTADSAVDLVNLPPFQTSQSGAAGKSSSSRNRPAKGGNPLKSILEVAGLFAVAVVLVAVGLRFGLPQKRLSDVPDDVTLITSASEKAEVFATVAGSYSTGKTAGNSLVIIRPDGQVLLGTIGKDGKATPPRIQEQARAGRKGNIACIITSFGIIAGTQPPDTVNVGRFQYKKAPTSVQ
jgi:hypothetical protein